MANAWFVNEGIKVIRPYWVSRGEYLERQRTGQESVVVPCASSWFHNELGFSIFLYKDRYGSEMIYDVYDADGSEETVAVAETLDEAKAIAAALRALEPLEDS